jgi:peptide/nickel transport system substrate-binding protein
VNSLSSVTLWRRRKSVTVTALSLTIVAALAAGCGGGGGSQTAALLKVGTSGSVDSLNPFDAFSALPYQLFGLEYPLLTTHAANGDVRGDLARSWSFADGGRTLTMKLRTNGKWSDGTPLTARDAAFTLQTVIKYKAGPGALFFGDIPTLESAAAPDAGTLVLRFTQPSPIAPAQLNAIPVLPQHVWSKHAGSSKALSGFANSAPAVGGGPFVFTRYAAKQFAIFTRNPYYYGPRPHVQRIGFTIYSSTDAMVQGIKTGEVDAVEAAPLSSLPTLRRIGVTIRNPVAFNGLWLTLNDSLAARAHLELHNLKVREALDMAIDRDRIVQTAFFGSAVPGAAALPPANGPDHLDAPPTPFDLAQANGILDGLGYRRGSDGIRVANGHPMSYRVILLQDTGGPEETTLEIIKNDFARIGVKLSVTPLDTTAALAALNGPKRDYATFDMFMFEFQSTYVPGGLLPVFRCDARGAYSYTGTCDKTFDKLDDARVAATDVATARRYTLAEQRWVMQHRPLLLIAYSKDIYAYKPSWTGLDPNPQGWFFSYHAVAEQARKR